MSIIGKALLGMDTLHRPTFVYIVRETLISVVINTAISCAFCFLQFHAFASIPWGGHAGLVRDAIPQTFAVAFMGVLVPTLITRSRGRRGALPAAEKLRSFVPATALIRALSAAVVAALCGFAATFILFGHEQASITFRSALAFKCGYGGLVAAIVTPLAVWMALHDSRLPVAERSAAAS